MTEIHEAPGAQTSAGLRWLPVLLCLTIGACRSASDAEESLVNLQKVHFKGVQGRSSEEYQAVSDHYRLAISTPDDPENPTAWDTALTITDMRNGNTCSTGPMLLQDVFTATRANLAAVMSYSASATYLNIYDMTTCRETSPQITDFKFSFKIKGSQIKTLPTCVELSGDVYSCTAGRVFKLEPSGTLTLLEKESAQLTKEYYGMEFVGEKKLRNPERFPGFQKRSFTSTWTFRMKELLSRPMWVALFSLVLILAGCGGFVVVKRRLK